MNQQNDFIPVEEIFWIQTFDGTDTTDTVAWYEEKGATASFSWGSNSEILWEHTRISHHKLQSEMPTEKWSKGSLDPWDLCMEASMIPRAKATRCHWELRGWLLFVCLFVCLFILPAIFFHWLLKREGKILQCLLSLMNNVLSFYRGRGGVWLFTCQKND